MDIDNLSDPITKNKYDRILFIVSIGYSINGSKLLNSCHKLLNNGGKIFITAGDYFKWHDLYKLINYFI